MMLVSCQRTRGNSGRGWSVSTGNPLDPAKFVHGIMIPQAFWRSVPLCRVGRCPTRNAGTMPMFYDPRRNDHGLPRDPFKSLIVPRPIGWVTTISRDGAVNLAPFSFFNAVAEAPPMVMFAPNGRKPDGAQKDSRVNVEVTGEFVLNLATYALREQMNATSTSLPADVDEMRFAGLTPLPSRQVKP